MVAVSYVQQFEEFLRDKCRKQLEELADTHPEQKSLVIDYSELEKTLRKLGVVPDSAYENPVEAFEIASEMAVEGNYDLIVLGSVYLVGDLFRHMVESNDWDLWESLSSH